MTVSPRQLMVVVFFMGLAAITFQVYRLNQFRLELRSLNVVQQQKEDANKKTPTEKSPALRLAELVSKHLMGVKTKQSSKLVTKPLIMSQLKLELVGTIRGGEKDSALIQSKGKETKRYFIGDQVDSGVVLKTVEADSVTLMRGNTVEVLGYSKVIMPAAVVQKQAAITPRSIAAARKTNAAKNKNGSSENSNGDTEQIKSENSDAPLSLRERLKRKSQGAQK